MANPSNSLQIVGRLAADPEVFVRNDGSKTVLFTVMADRNFQNKGKYLSDAIPFEAFVPAHIEGNGPYGRTHKGDLVAINGALRMDRYTDKSGKEVFALKAVPESVTYLESRAVTQARQAAKASGEPIAVEDVVTEDQPFAA
jgi:single-strand DNA-binding protein